MVEESEGQQVETFKLINLDNGVPEGKIPVRMRNKLDMNIGIALLCVSLNSGESIERLIEANKPVFSDGQERQIGYDLVGGKTYHVGVNRRAITVYAIQYFELRDDPDYEGRLKKFYNLMQETAYVPPILELKESFPEVDFDSTEENT